jgi:hypothetical protein
MTCLCQADFLYMFKPEQPINRLDLKIKLSTKPVVKGIYRKSTLLISFFWVVLENSTA